MRRIRIQIGADGRISVQTEGIKGDKCTQYIRILEEMMDAETIESRYTSERYESEVWLDQDIGDVNTEQNRGRP